MRQGFIKDDNTKYISYNIEFLMIQMNQVRSEDNVVDLFTKSLPNPRLRSMSRALVCLNYLTSHD